MNILKNNKGFNLVQVMVGLGLTGLISFGVMSQLEIFRSSSISADRKIELDTFLDNITRAVITKTTCDINFAGVNVATSNPSILLANAAGKVLIQEGQSYLSNAITIESIRLNQIPDQNSEFSLIITATKNKEKKAYNRVIRNIKIAADMNGALVDSCYFSMSNVEAVDTVCAGPGVDVNNSSGEMQCYFKQFELNSTLSHSCPSGQVLKGMMYANTSANPYQYLEQCRPVFTITGCPDNRVKTVNADGSFECFNVSDRVDTTTAHTFTNGNEYKLIVNSSNQISILQTTVTTPPTATCPAASTVACGNPVLDSSGAATCGTTGTALNTNQCADPATVCSGDPIVDNCNNSCPSGTLGASCTPSCSGGSWTSTNIPVVTPVGPSTDGNCIIDSSFNTGDCSYECFSDGSCTAVDPSCIQGTLYYCPQATDSVSCGSYSHCMWLGEAPNPFGSGPSGGENASTTTINSCSDLTSQSSCQLNSSNGCSWDDCGASACTSPPIATNGVCNNLATNSCSAGVFIDQPDSPSQQLWRCDGLNGGSDASCSMAATSTCTYPTNVGSVNDCVNACPSGPTRMCQKGNSDNTLILCPGGRPCSCQSARSCSALTGPGGGTGGGNTSCITSGNFKPSGRVCCPGVGASPNGNGACRIGGRFCVSIPSGTDPSTCTWL